MLIDRGLIMEFQLIAIVVLIIFYGCYLIKMFCQRKRGIQTDQIGKGKVGFVRFIEITMKIASFFVLITQLVSIIAGVNNSSYSVRIAGSVISFAGTLIFIDAVLTMHDSWRAGVSQTDKTELVTNGIYSISRNPAFLGFDLMYIGILLMFFNWLLFVATVLAVLMYHLQIVMVEEVFLLGSFKDEYMQYKNTVCRYIGRKS